MKKNFEIALKSDYSDNITHSKPIKKLSFGKRLILLSDEEFEKLENIYLHYIEIYGVELGFMHYLLKNFRGNV